MVGVAVAATVAAAAAVDNRPRFETTLGKRSERRVPKPEVVIPHAGDEPSGFEPSTPSP